MLEESPGLKRPNSATELLGVKVLDAQLQLSRGGTGPGRPPPETVLQGAVAYVGVDSLHGCVEHRRVLSFDLEVCVCARACACLFR